MRNYSNLFFLPFALVVLFTLFSGFTNNSEYALVEKLLKERTDILHKVYFKQIDIETGEKLLYEIETPPILTWDIKEMRKYEDTDMDSVRDMEMLTLDKVSDLYGLKSYIGDILWHMQGPEGRYIQSVDYNIVLKGGRSGYKLSEFNSIEPKKPKP